MKILGIYALILAAGAMISLQIYFSGKAINSTTNDLLNRNVPILADIATIQIALTDNERSLYEYYATTDQRVMHQQQVLIHRNLSQAMARVRSQLPAARSLDQIESYIANIDRLALSLDQTLSSPSIDWELARARLVQITEQGRSVAPLLSALHKHLQTAVLGTSDIVKDNTRDTTHMVLLFSVLVIIVAALVAFYLDRFIRLAAERTFLAYNDSLTRLPNRQQFEQVAQSLAESEYTNVLGLIKLDRFTRLTSAHGYLIGDDIIKAAAQRIDERLHGRGCLYRFDGASFGFTINFMSNEQLLENVLNAFETPLIINGAEFYMTISIGYCLTTDDADDGHSLIKNADACVSLIKREGGNRIRRYTPELQQQEQAWMALENELRNALFRNELVVHYQPQVSARSGQLVGMEALIRWQSPLRGMVSPMDFIPLAEQTGLIIKIGEWVMREACRQAQYWQQTFARDCVVAVNISPKQFLNHNFLSMVTAVLSETKVDPALIEFEITEGVMVENIEYCMDILRQLKALGIKLSIDDFGTGYSSMSYLKQLCVDKIKVDRAFVNGLPRDTDDIAIVRSIIDLSHNLGLTVIAEGVETEEQHQLLSSFGCEELQGYLISRPQPAHSLSAFFNQTSVFGSVGSIAKSKFTQ